MIANDGEVCPVCGAMTSNLVTTGRDRSFGNSGTFAIQQCGDCKVMYLTPRLSVDAASTYYHAADHAVSCRLTPGWARYLGSIRFKRQMHRINRKISEFVSGGTLLDVGCGRGEFLFGMTKYRQWTLRGLEMNTNLAQFVTEVFHVPVLIGRLDQVLPAGVTYDAITLWDVFEHLRDPDDALSRLKESLSRGGLLVIKMPNPESLGARLFGACWSGWGVPQHYFTWPRNAFEAFVQKRGMRIVGTSYLYGAHNDLVTSIGFTLQGIIRDRLLKLVTHVLSLPPFMLALSPLVMLELTLGQPSSITYFLERSE